MPVKFQINTEISYFFDFADFSNGDKPAELDFGLYESLPVLIFFHAEGISVMIGENCDLAGGFRFRSHEHIIDFLAVLNPDVALPDLLKFLEVNTGDLESIVKQERGRGDLEDMKERLLELSRDLERMANHLTIGELDDLRDPRNPDNFQFEADDYTTIDMRDYRMR